jgi:hypothetical protein
MCAPQSGELGNLAGLFKAVFAMIARIPSFLISWPIVARNFRAIRGVPSRDIDDSLRELIHITVTHLRHSVLHTPNMARLRAGSNPASRNFQFQTDAVPARGAACAASRFVYSARPRSLPGTTRLDPSG